MVYQKNYSCNDDRGRHIPTSQCLVQTLFVMYVIYLICFFASSLLQVVKIVRERDAGLKVPVLPLQPHHM